MRSLRELARHVNTMIQHGTHDMETLKQCKRAYFILVKYAIEDIAELADIYAYLKQFSRMPALGETH